MARPKHTVRFKPNAFAGRAFPANPDWPHGIALDTVSDASIAYCQVELPYPAPECGYHMVVCSECNLRVAVSAAGRADDPVSIRLRCVEAVN